VARVHLNNPAKLNAFTPDMLRQLEAHCDRIEEDLSIRGVLVTAEGERAFCAGADIIGWGALSPTISRGTGCGWGTGSSTGLAAVAADDRRHAGACVRRRAGAGHGLRHPGDGAGGDARLPEAQVGIVPGWSGTQRLARLLPEPVLKEMALFGRRLSAERAHGAGLRGRGRGGPARGGDGHRARGC
jgi:enoyl-CoA hydratase